MIQNAQTEEARRLRPIERELLDYFASHRGVVQKRVPIVGMEKNTSLRVYVHRLRQKIGKHKIVTVHGQGYVYVGDGVKR